MQHSISDGANIFSVKLSGKVTYQEVDDLKKIISQFEGATAPDIEFDVTNVKMIDSSGLGQLVTAFDAAEAKRGKVTIRGASGVVLSTLKTTRFDELATLV